MLDKNEEQLEIGDYVNLSSAFALGLSPQGHGIIARIDLDSDTAENVLVLAESNGMPLPMPSSAGSLSKAIIADENKKADLVGVLSIFRWMEEDIKAA